MATPDPAPSAPTPDATDAFLSGQGIPVALADVEGQLAALWGPTAERADGPDLERPAVTRVSLANLVVACLDSSDGTVEAVLDQLAARRPCRVIVLKRNASAERQVTAKVSALCFLPAPGLPQVCSERIVLEAGPAALDLLPGTVLSLLEPGLPMELWWVGDPTPHRALYRALGAEAARVIPDVTEDQVSRAVLRQVLDPAINPHLRDLTWFAISRWRELIAQFFDAPGAVAALDRLTAVTIEVATPNASEPPRVGLWLAAWLAGQLGWLPLSAERSEDGRVQARFQAQGRQVLVDLQPVAAGSGPPCIQRVELLAAGPGADAEAEESFGLTRLAGDRGDVRIELCSAGRCQLPRTVHAPEYDEAHRISAALESARDDRPYRAALPIFCWLLDDGSTTV